MRNEGMGERKEIKAFCKTLYNKVPDIYNSFVQQLLITY